MYIPIPAQSSHPWRHPAVPIGQDTGWLPEASLDDVKEITLVNLMAVDPDCSVVHPIAGRCTDCTSRDSWHQAVHGTSENFNHERLFVEAASPGL
jgi:hypothetical protein